jgi:hypothetical protein
MQLFLLGGCETSLLASIACLALALLTAEFAGFPVSEMGTTPMDRTALEPPFSEVLAGPTNLALDHVCT